MKFKTQIDELQYKLLQTNETILRRKLRINTKSKDRKKSKNMKDFWRRNKNTILKGIKKWNKSTQGKRFHRALGRFNALREGAYLYSYYYNDANKSNNSNDIDNNFNSDNKNIQISIDLINEALLGLSSIETHLFLELQYYEPSPENMSEYIDMIQQFISDSSILKEELLDAYISGEISGENYILLNDILQFFQDPVQYTYEKRKINNKTNDINEMDENEKESFNKQIEFAKSLDYSQDIHEFYKKLDELIENSIK